MRIAGTIFGKRFDFSLGGKSGKRGYDAAKNNRITAGWNTFPLWADQELKNDNASLRTRARDLAKNDALGSRYVNLVKKNTAGAFGFKLEVKAMKRGADKKEVLDTDTNNLIKAEFTEWTKIKNCDVSERRSFRRMQHTLMSHVATDGEFLVRKIFNKSKHGFQLQLLEPDLLDEQYSAQMTNGNVVIMGIELDQWGKRVAYHIRKYNPKTGIYVMNHGGERERVPASDIYYDFYVDHRALQTRGASPMSPSMLRMRLVSDYERAAVTNAIGAARRLGFLQRKAEGGAFDGDTKDANDNIIIEQEELSFHQLPDGWEVQQPDPKYPDAQHEMFMKSEQKMIASGLDTSYSGISSDLTQTSYGSGRIGLLDERESWQMMQEWFIESFLEPVYEDWLKSALVFAEPLYGLKMTEFDRYNKPYWVGKRWKWVDPEKDANADLIEMRSGLSSLKRKLAERGDDLDEILDEMKEVQDKAKTKGVVLDFDSQLIDMQEDLDGEAEEDKQSGNRKRSAIATLRQIKQMVLKLNGQLEEA